MRWRIASVSTRDRADSRSQTVFLRFHVIQIRPTHHYSQEFIGFEGPTCESGPSTKAQHLQRHFDFSDPAASLISAPDQVPPLQWGRLVMSCSTRKQGAP